MFSVNCVRSMRSMTKEDERVLKEIAARVPKCELHLHLDGSLSPRFICQRLISRGVPLPEGVSESGDGLRAHLHHMKANHVLNCDNRAEKNKNWGVFDFCNQVLQTEEELVAGTCDVLEQMFNENVKICEIRFCPSLHTLDGLSPLEATRAVIKGFQVGSAKFEMMGGVILCGLRSCTPQATLNIAQLCVQLSQESGGIILGYDIAGDEGSYPIDGHIPSLQYASNGGVGVTCHAGEWPVNDKFGNSSLTNLQAVISDGNLVERVGHGIQVIQDTELLTKMGTLISYKRICFECCLTANVGWKVASYDVHPIKDMINSGAKVALCSDNLLLSGSADRSATPTNEIIHFVRDVGMSYDDLRKVLKNSVESSFIYKAQSWSDERALSWLSQYDNEVNNILSMAQNV